MSELYNKEVKLRDRLVTPQMQMYWNKLFTYELAKSMSQNDLDGLQRNNIYFNVTFFPSSTTTIRAPLDRGHTLINLDYDSLMKLPEDHRIAILLHELGHAFNPIEPKETKEFVADCYAVDRKYGHALLENLKSFIMKYPDMYNNDLTKERIKKLEDKDNCT